MNPPVRVLAVGDPYMPAASFAAALGRLGDAVTITELQITRTDAEPARTASERRLREYAGDPAQVARAAAGHEVLVLPRRPGERRGPGRARTAPGLLRPRRTGQRRRGAASERGIPVVSTPGKNAEAVAELTIAFALMLIRGLPRASRYIADGGRLAESTFEGGEFFGTEAPGTVLGLVGLGHVGRQAAIRAAALGFTVLAHDPLPPAVRPDAVDPGRLRGAAGRVRHRLGARRATAANRHLFGAKAFALMKPGASFINTARESLVDEARAGRRAAPRAARRRRPRRGGAARRGRPASAA